MRAIKIGGKLRRLRQDKHLTQVQMAAELGISPSYLNLLESMLPSLVSKCAPGDARGAAIGVNSTAQFLGAFAGAAAGGWLPAEYEQAV